MNSVDIIFAVAALIGIIYGLKTGLVKQLSLGAGIIIGLLQAAIFYRQAGEWIKSLSGWEEWICNIVGYVGIVLIVAIALNLLGLLLRWLLKVVLLGIVDRIAGATFSAAIALGIAVFAINTSEKFIPDNEVTGKTKQKESLLYKDIAALTYTIIDEVKEEVDFD